MLLTLLQIQVLRLGELLYYHLAPADISDLLHPSFIQSKWVSSLWWNLLPCSCYDTYWTWIHLLWTGDSLFQWGHRLFIRPFFLLVRFVCHVAWIISLPVSLYIEPQLWGKLKMDGCLLSESCGRTAPTLKSPLIANFPDQAHTSLGLI